MSDKIQNNRVISTRSGVSEADAKRKAELAARSYAYSEDYYLDGRASFTKVSQKLSGWTATCSFKVVKRQR